MNPSEPDPTMPQPALPWNWRKICLCTAGAFVCLLGLLVLKLRQPWGEPLPGISLASRYASSLSDVRPGSFWDLVEQAAASYHVGAEDGNLFLIIDELGRDFDLRPEGAKPALLTAAEVSLLEKASELPLSECRVPLDFMKGKATGKEMEKLFLLLRMHTWLAIDEADPARAAHFIQVQLQLCERLRQGGNIALLSQINDWQIGAMRGIQLSAARFASPEQIGQLRAILASTSNMDLDLAEWLRLHLHAVEFDPSQSSGSDWVNICVGYTVARQRANVRFVYSHVLAELDAGSKSEQALDKLRELIDMGRSRASKFRNHLRSDWPTRLYLFRLDDEIRQMTIPSAKVAALQKALTQAVLAVCEYRQRVGHWPDALADAMTDVPPDPFANYHAPIKYELEPDKTNWKLFCAPNRYLTATGHTPVSSATLLPAKR